MNPRWLICISCMSICALATALMIRENHCLLASIGGLGMGIWLSNALREYGA